VKKKSSIIPKSMLTSNTKNILRYPLGKEKDSCMLSFFRLSSQPLTNNLAERVEVFSDLALHSHSVALAQQMS
jgi:hypothetical protein